MIVGIGTDVVHIPRIQSIVTKYGVRFLKRAFHPSEIQTYEKRNHSVQYLASLYVLKLIVMLFET
jgi:holo-[acyl-carrier protein] synthase